VMFSVEPSGAVDGVLSSVLMRGTIRRSADSRPVASTGRAKGGPRGTPGYSHSGSDDGRRERSPGASS
jgi:hypothetical protein